VVRYQYDLLNDAVPNAFNCVICVWVSYRSHASALAQGSVVWATDVSIGRGHFSGTRRLKIPRPNKLLFCTVAYSVRPGQNSWRSPRGFCLSITWKLQFSCFLFLSSQSHAQVERVCRLSRIMAQITRFRLRKCILGVTMTNDLIKGSISPLSPKNSHWFGWESGNA
jgi:hypothetical protein